MLSVSTGLVRLSKRHLVDIVAVGDAAIRNVPYNDHAVKRATVERVSGPLSCRHLGSPRSVQYLASDDAQDFDDVPAASTQAGQDAVSVNADTAPYAPPAMSATEVSAAVFMLARAPEAGAVPVGAALRVLSPPRPSEGASSSSSSSSWKRHWIRPFGSLGHLLPWNLYDSSRAIRVPCGGALPHAESIPSAGAAET